MMSEVIHQDVVVPFPDVHLPTLSNLCFHEADANLKLENNNFCLKSLRLRNCIEATCGSDISRSRHLESVVASMSYSEYQWGFIESKGESLRGQTDPGGIGPNDST
jgi:hypothetical protein